jgi:hypothetical protein
MQKRDDAGIGALTPPPHLLAPFKGLGNTIYPA